MRGRRALVIAAVFVGLFACKRERRSKNDDIAACNASGGQWVEGGCSNGRCERPAGMAPNDDDDELYGEEEGDDD